MQRLTSTTMRVSQPGKLRWEQDVLISRQSRNQVIRLKNKPKVIAPERHKFIAPKRANICTGDSYSTGGQRLKTR
jgi:hypothetical protein